MYNTVPVEIFYFLMSGPYAHQHPALMLPVTSGEYGTQDKWPKWCEQGAGRWGQSSEDAVQPTGQPPPHNTNSVLPSTFSGNNFVAPQRQIWNILKISLLLSDGPVLIGMARNSTGIHQETKEIFSRGQEPEKQCTEIVGDVLWCLTSATQPYNYRMNFLVYIIWVLQSKSCTALTNKTLRGARSQRCCSSEGWSEQLRKSNPADNEMATSTHRAQAKP